MRRLLALVPAALLLAAALGCHHTAGVCDCGIDTCYPGPGHDAAAAVKAEPVQAEPIKVMPKAGPETGK